MEGQRCTNHHSHAIILTKFTPTVVIFCLANNPTVIQFIGSKGARWKCPNVVSTYILLAPGNEIVGMVRPITIITCDITCEKVLV